MAEELIYKVSVEGTNELNKLETSVEKAGESTNKTTSHMAELSAELRKARGDMLKYAKGTEEYNKALEKSSRLTSQVNDVNAKMKTGVLDLGQTTSKVASSLAGFAGGFQVVQSAMSLFGIENEETIKTVLKLQQTMSIVQGLTTFAQGIFDAQELLASFRASNHQLNEDLKTTGDGMEGVSKSSDSMGDSLKASGKESAVLGSNLAGNTKIADDLSKGLGDVTKGLNEMGDRAAHIAKIQDLNRTMDDLNDNIDVSTKHLEGLTEGTEEYNAAQRAIERNNEKLIKVTEEYEETLKNGIKATEDGAKAQENLSKSTKKTEKAVTSFGKSIAKSLGTMAAFLAIIALVTWGVSELIK